MTREQWAWVEGLIRDVSRPEEGNIFARRVFQWDLAVRQFQKVEHERIVVGTPTDVDFEAHARCLQGLLTIGNALVMASREFQPEELARFGIRREEIGAYVEALEQSFREWHHGLSEEYLDKVRQALFSGEA